MRIMHLMKQSSSREFPLESLIEFQMTSLFLVFHFIRVLSIRCGANMGRHNRIDTAENGEELRDILYNCQRQILASGHSKPSRCSKRRKPTVSSSSKCAVQSAMLRLREAAHSGKRRRKRRRRDER